MDREEAEIMMHRFVRWVWRPRILKSGAAGLAGLSLLGTALIAGAGPKPPMPPSPSPVARGVLLAPENRPEVYNRLPPEKKALVDRENQLRNQALEHPFKVGPRPPIPTPKPLPPDLGLGTSYWPAGAGTIRKIGCEQNYRGYGLQSNAWIEKLPDRTLLICAGARPDAPSQGWLFITVDDPKGHPLPKDQQLLNPFFPTPTKAGLVIITDAVGEVLTLQAKDGTLFYFDVGSLKYVDGPPAPAAEKTPTP
jgi:hypothetical protein